MMLENSNFKLTEKKGRLQTHWRWLGIQRILSPNKSTVNEQIVEILIHSSTENFQPELQLNSEQKADEMHVSPAIANALVVCS